MIYIFCCNNIRTDSNVIISQDGKPSISVKLSNVILNFNRKVEWFSVEEGVVVIKLKREK